MTRNPITVVIGIDMETDVGSFTPYYEGLVNGTPRLLDLFDELGIETTFLFTGEAAAAHPEVAKECLTRGHEVGCHSYQHETVGDPLFDLPGTKPILPHEVFPRIELNTELVEKATGVRPVSFRCPRLWGSTAVVQSLAKLGYTADLTYPMYFYREQFEPYFVDLNDWTKPGDSTLLQIPNFADMTMESNDPGLERDRDQWPLFRTIGGQYMLERSLAFDEFCRDKGIDTFLCYYIHPWEFWPVEESYNFGEATVIPDEFITKNCGDVALDEFRVLLRGLLDAGAEFKMSKDLPELVRERQAVRA
ncbi:hypothetical protein BW730_12580 [Tessaracoccus aquimaris]|uniref:NodB homology domain-containing protein n=1 Tax=Tessaracoccus aquimaris TaxID=1332264 RepID=A0A1Q2CQ40_9ACTN|nr:polysaccharide deacetylase family protein [Tessaracoccus aquimaris]AQP48214.1 hypothetical protein BW730_12580 [Tessaracoccus aquimaris]